MAFDWFKKGKKRSKRIITADERASIRAMLEEGFTTAEVRDHFPDIPYFVVKNINSAITKASKPTETKVSTLAKEFKALADLQNTMLDTEVKRRKSIMNELRAELERAEPLSEDTTDDRIVDMFLDVMQQKMQQPQPAQPAGAMQFKAINSSSKPLPKPITPAGAHHITDAEIKSVIDEIPKTIRKLIKKGKISKRTCWNYCKKQNIDKETFDRAWLMIK